MAGLKYRILLALPLLAFLMLCGLFLLRGRPGSWHGRCEEFWQRQDWAKLQGLAQNLELLGTPDPETEYFAAMASRELNDAKSAAQFAARWQQRKALNWNWERDLAALSASQGWITKAGFYRSRAATILLLFLAVVNILSLRRPRWTYACSLASLAGIVLLLV